MPNYKTPPGPTSVTSLFGVLRFVQRLQKDMLGTFIEWQREYGDFYALRIMGAQRFMVTHPDAVYQVAVAQAAKFHKDIDYKDPKKGLARFLGNGLLVSDGEFWKRQRRLAAPALHTKRITAYADDMVEITLQMLDQWRDSARLDISKEMTGLTMKIVARTLFNADVSSDVDRIGSAIEVIQRASGEPSMLPAWIPTPLELRARRAKRDLDELVYRLINERRATGEDKGDLLSMLLLAEDEDGSRMTDQQARDEAVTLFLAGHETTANALNWTWLLLAQHPEAEERLHAELDSVLAGKPPTLADLKLLPYTEMVIKESMRLYPPAWGFSREAIEDVEIGDYLVPKGSVVGILAYLTHRDPRWWDEPEKFNPERFTPENEANLPKYAYIPFGAGPRICIGNAFAMLEAQLLLATIASRFRLRLNPGQKVEMLPLITLNPKGGLPMTLREREVAREPILT